MLMQYQSTIDYSHQHNALPILENRAETSEKHYKYVHDKAMLHFTNSVDPFSIDGLVDIPEIDTEPSAVWQAFKSSSASGNETFKLAEVEADPLPDLQTKFFQLDFHDVPLPDLDSSISSNANSDGENVADDELERGVEEVEDIWVLPDISKRREDTKLKTWDNFLNEEHIEPATAYLSEHGAETFSLIFHSTSDFNNRPTHRIVRPDVLLASLCELGMGRESVLFFFDRKKNIFVAVDDGFVAHGLGVQSTAALVESAIQDGGEMRRLMDSTSSAVTGAISSHSVRIAFASCVSSVLYGIQAYVERSRHTAESLLQVQRLLERPRFLIRALNKLLLVVDLPPASTDFMAALSSTIQSSIELQPWTEDIFQGILARTVTPVLRELETLSGLRSPSAAATGSSMLRQANTGGEFSGIKLMTTVLPSEIEQVVQESKDSLDLLMSYAPNHPVLCDSDSLQNMRCHRELELGYSWDAIVELQNRATDYERQLQTALIDLRKNTDRRQQMARFADQGQLITTPFSIETALALPLDSESSLGQPLGHRTTDESDRLFDLVAQTLYNGDHNRSQTILKPNAAEITSLSLMPMLKAQHRLLSYTVLKSLFLTSHVRQHLDLQAQFQLLGDGLFASRLSQALFDPDQGSGEGRRHTGTSTGLRLQNRDTWPPASSELRLVLMGILTESLTSNAKPDHPDILDSMSFAIRDLGDEDLEKCRDPDSIHALDFLRLQYKPPNALLEAIITPVTLQKYERLFNHLLRLLRVQSIARNLLREATSRGRHSQLKRSDQLLRMDIQHFVSTLADYSHNIAIGLPWRRLQTTLAQVEGSLDQNDYERTLLLARGLAHMRRLHEEILSEMTGSLFLNRKRFEAGLLVEDLFGMVLRFAKLSRRDDSDNELIKRLHEDFRNGVGKLLRYLQSQSGLSVASPASSRGPTAAGAFEQLLVRLDLFENWSRGA